MRSESEPQPEPRVRRNHVLHVLTLALVVLNVGFFAFSTITRTRHFDDPDAMNFVDVARNVAAGRGIVQSTLGFNQPTFTPEDGIPTPLTSQSPVMPVLIGGLALVGVAPIDGGVWLSLACFGLIVALAFRLTYDLLDRSTACVVAAGTAAYLPLQYWSRTAMSDALGLAVVLLALLVLLRLSRCARPGSGLVLLAGLTAGAAVALRYALAPLGGVALVVVVLAVPAGRRVAMAAVCLAGFAVALAPVLIRGLVIGPSGGYLGSETGFLVNVVDAVMALAGDYADVPGASRTLRPPLVAAVLAGGLLFGIASRRASDALRTAWFSRGAWLLTLWTCSYLGFLIIYRSVNHVDRLTTRLVLPVAIVVLVQVAVWLARTVRPRAAWSYLLAIGILLGSSADHVQAYRAAEPYSAEAMVDASPRLRWISDHTSPADLLIGDDIVDVPFLLERQAAISFSPFPYSDHVDWSRLVETCRAHASDSNRVLLVLRNRLPSEEVWTYAFGPFITDLAFGRLASYPNLVEIARFDDGSVFEVRCGSAQMVPAAQDGAATSATAGGVGP